MKAKDQRDQSYEEPEPPPIIMLSTSSRAGGTRSGHGAAKTRNRLPLVVVATAVATSAVWLLLIWLYVMAAGKPQRGPMEKLGYSETFSRPLSRGQLLEADRIRIEVVTRPHRSRARIESGDEMWRRIQAAAASSADYRDYCEFTFEKHRVRCRGRLAQRSNSIAGEELRNVRVRYSGTKDGSYEFDYVPEQ